MQKLPVPFPHMNDAILIKLQVLMTPDEGVNTKLAAVEKCFRARDAKADTNIYRASSIKLFDMTARFVLGHLSLSTTYNLTIHSLDATPKNTQHWLSTLGHVNSVGFSVPQTPFYGNGHSAQTAQSNACRKERSAYLAATGSGIHYC